MRVFKGGRETTGKGTVRGTETGWGRLPLVTTSGGKVISNQK